MISSAKMHKAEGSLKRLQPYRATVEEIINNLLCSDATFTSPLTTPRAVSHITIVILGSDDGLCGAYNVNLSKVLVEKVRALHQEHGDKVAINIVAVGSKMFKAVSAIKHKDGFTVSAAEGVDSKSSGDAVKAFEASLESEFVSGNTDLVYLLYMNYQSAARQRPAFDPILPLSQEMFKKSAEAKDIVKPYLFEPDAHTIFETVIPMYLLALVQEVFVENQASEQAARVMAMQSAHDNAKKLLDQLRLEYNKLRQQSITTELLDIVGGQVRD